MCFVCCLTNKSSLKLLNISILYDGLYPTCILIGSYLYDLLEVRCIDCVIISNMLLLSYKTNFSHVVMGLYINRSQKSSESGKNISDIPRCALCATFLF